MNHLEKYAALAVEVGINLKPQEGLIVGCNASGLPLAREIVDLTRAPSFWSHSTTEGCS